ncbi:MAG: DUF4867 family protein [Lachnospiraceae bacterium]|nr:DUF4867 family protein [Lachnospiraceae bacterium]
MLVQLKEKNPNIQIYAVDSNEFASYGRVIKELDATEILKVAETIPMPEVGSVYAPSQGEFEKLSIAEDIRDLFYGELPTQVGYCYGHSNFMNALEWHNCNEINIAVTPMVLILGLVTELREGKIDSSQAKVFYVPKGTVLEVYSTTLHFCPCEVEETGFGCVVALPTGTNTPLERESKNKVLFRKNKWLIAHNENKALLEKGVVAGISGENIQIKY